MTVEELKTYYAELLIKQYSSKTRAVATIKAITEEFVFNLLPLTIQSAFDISTAVGEQLEWIAKYVGLESRVVNYNGPYELSDAELRFIIPFLAVKNTTRSSFKQIKEMLYLVQPTNVKVFDNLTMKLTYYVKNPISSEIQILIAIDGLPRPAAVGAYPVIGLDSFDYIFSYKTYSAVAPVGSTWGFSTYDTLPNTSKWISYSDAL